jgi:hypothetical protein
VLCFSVLDFIHFVGGWVAFEGCFATLGFGSAHQVLDKSPEPVFIMPRVQASSSWSSGTQAIVARPTFQSRKLILETSFTIKEDFTDFDVMRWAVQELKHRRLKRLFKPVTSTAYERLV